MQFIDLPAPTVSVTEFAVMRWTYECEHITVSDPRLAIRPCYAAITILAVAR